MVLSLLRTPISLALNYVIIPDLNKRLAKGLPLPKIVAKVGGYTMTINIVNPILGFGEGYVLVGTDAQISIKPSADGVTMENEYH